MSPVCAPTGHGPDRDELLSHLVTWCPGCGSQLTLADCVSVSLVSLDFPSHTEWQCVRCARAAFEPETAVYRRSRVA